MRKLLIPLCLLVGCITPGYQPHGSVVTIRQRTSIGTGVVIGENLVITASHVVDEPGYIKLRLSKNPLKRYTEFRKLAEISHDRENIVALYGPWEFSPTMIFKVGCDSPPFMIQTRRGLFELTEYTPQGGDSGSAVMCEHGHLVGVHWGSRTYSTRKEPLFLLFKD